MSSGALAQPVRIRTAPVGSGAGAAAAPAAARDGAWPPGTLTGPLNLQGRAIERVQFRGNRKVEDDAIRVQLLSKPGALLDAAKLRDDLRAMWKMGFFDDVEVEAEVAAGRRRHR